MSVGRLQVIVYHACIPAHRMAGSPWRACLPPSAATSLRPLMTLCAMLEHTMDRCVLGTSGSQYVYVMLASNFLSSLWGPESGREY